jgi:hypothetical protein
MGCGCRKNKVQVQRGHRSVKKTHKPVKNKTNVQTHPPKKNIEKLFI